MLIASGRERLQRAHVLLWLRPDEYTQSPRLRFTRRNMLLKLAQPSCREHKASQHPRMLLASIVRVVRDGSFHVERCRRKEAGVVDEVREKHTERLCDMRRWFCLHRQRLFGSKCFFSPCQHS